jgi:hypothetical protein
MEFTAMEIHAMATPSATHQTANLEYVHNQDATMFT